MATVPEFEPVPLRPRHDGWSAERQMRFIEALAEGATVEAAARRVGMTRDSAYKLRRRPCGTSFRRAWDAALDCNMAQVEQAAISARSRASPGPSSTRASRSANGATMMSA